MRFALVAVAALSLVACSKAGNTPAATGDASAPSAAAQSPAAAADTPAVAPQADASASGNSAVKPAHMDNAAPLAAGSNSFTEAQARTHIEHSGYTGVTDLTKDDKGVWHGKAMKGSQAVNVSLDFKGNVVTN